MKGYMLVAGEKIPVDDIKINEWRYPVEFPTEPFNIIKGKTSFDSRTNKMNFTVERSLTQKEVCDRVKNKMLCADEWIVMGVMQPEESCEEGVKWLL